MPEIAEIIREHGPAYLARCGERLLPSHRRALRDLAACRTEVLGGHLAQCDHCGHRHYSYHSCRNRSCPKCHSSDTERWLERRQAELLPIPYFHVVFTVPEALRELVSRHQKLLYGVLLKAAAEALDTLTADPRYVGGEVGILSVLHTWGRQLMHHPHVHCLVTGGGLTADGTWRPARKGFLVPVAALSKIFRARFMAMARKALPAQNFPDSIWEKDWVAYCKPARQGSKKVLDYLGRYVHRVAITNSRILAVRGDQVTFEYKDSKDNQWKRRTLSAEEFLRRFLQHVLPKGFHKVRGYGLLSPHHRGKLQQLQLLLSMPEPLSATDSEAGQPANETQTPCPQCAVGIMVVITWIPRPPRAPP
jgi:hypothetical protein